MLIKLLPEQVGLFWDGIRSSLIAVNSIPENLTQDYSIIMLKEILLGNIQCWVMYEVIDSGEKEIYGIGTTQIIDGATFGVRMLRLNSIFGLRPISDEQMADATNVIIEYAKANKCTAIETYTNHPRAKYHALKNNYVEHQTVYRRYF